MTLTHGQCPFYSTSLPLKGAEQKERGGHCRSLLSSPTCSWAADGPPERQEWLLSWTRAPWKLRAASHPISFSSLPASFPSSLLHSLSLPDGEPEPRAPLHLTMQLLTTGPGLLSTLPFPAGIFKELLGRQRPRLIKRRAKIPGREGVQYILLCRDEVDFKGHFIGEVCFRPIPLNYQYVN